MVQGTARHRECPHLPEVLPCTGARSDRADIYSPPSGVRLSYSVWMRLVLVDAGAGLATCRPLPSLLLVPPGRGIVACRWRGIRLALRSDKAHSAYAGAIHHQCCVDRRTLGCQYDRG